MLRPYKIAIANRSLHFATIEQRFHRAEGARWRRDLDSASWGGREEKASARFGRNGSSRLL